MSAERAPGTFTVAEIAQRFGVSPETVSGWIAGGELRAVNVSRSHLEEAAVAHHGGGTGGVRGREDLDAGAGVGPAGEAEEARERSD